jgi:hypothetical protein
MAFAFMRSCVACIVATFLAAAGSGHAQGTGRRATEAEFRRHAAELKKLRRSPQHDAGWDRRFAATVGWLFDNAEIFADGRRSCAEMKRRLGPPDPPSPLDVDALPEVRQRRARQSAPPEEEVLVYSAPSHDAIGDGRISLQIDCRNGKTTSVAFEGRAS